jgi:hypothetical protein
MSRSFSFYPLQARLPNIALHRIAATLRFGEN